MNYTKFNYINTLIIYKHIYFVKRKKKGKKKNIFVNTSNETIQRNFRVILVETQTLLALYLNQLSLTLNNLNRHRSHVFQKS